MKTHLWKIQPLLLTLPTLNHVGLWCRVVPFCYTNCRCHQTILCALLTVVVFAYSLLFGMKILLEIIKWSDTPVGNSGKKMKEEWRLLGFIQSHCYAHYQVGARKHKNALETSWADEREEAGSHSVGMVSPLLLLLEVGGVLRLTK